MIKTGGRDLTKMKAIVTVIIPVYNKEKYITQCLSNLLSQTFGDFECIVVDDGSTDNSGILSEEIAKTDKRFTVYHTENRGVSAARNLALDKAKGKYITFIDSDDEFSNDYLENLVDCIERTNSKFVIGTIKKVWNISGNYQIIKYPKSGEFEIDQVLQNFAVIQENTGIFGFCTSKIFLNSLTKDIRFDESICLAEDFDYYLNLYSRIDKLFFDDKPNYFYFQKEQQIEGKDQFFDLRDDKTDYISQLKINLRYRKFLMLKGFYTGQNRQIVDRKISDYIFFALQHSDSDQITQVYSQINDLLSRYAFQIIPVGSLWERMVLIIQKAKLLNLQNIFQTSYHSARKLIWNLKSITRIRRLN